MPFEGGEISRIRTVARSICFPCGMSRVRLDHNRVNAYTCGILTFQVDDPHCRVRLLGVAAYERVQTAQGQYQTFPQRQRDRPLWLVPFPPIRSWQEGERSQSSVAGRMQERRDQPRMHSKLLHCTARSRIDGPLLDVRSVSYHGCCYCTQMPARQALRAYTGAEHQGVGQRDRDRLLHQHSGRQERLRLSSAMRRTMPK